MTEREMYDRLLELAYAGTPRGCRHEWVRVSDADEPYQMFVCRCGWEGGDEEAPAVGDGSQMSLGELVRLAKKLGLGNIFLNWLDDGRCWVQVGYHPTCFEAMGEAFDLHEELALAAAILAAVDGEQA